LIVTDASAVLELLLNSAVGIRIADRFDDPEETLHAPFLLDIEVLQVLRRYVLAGEIDDTRGSEAVLDLGSLPIERYPVDGMIDRIWELRSSLTACDATYVALAEALDAPLLTCDARLARAHGHDARVELIS